MKERLDRGRLALLRAPAFAPILWVFALVVLLSAAAPAPERTKVVPVRAAAPSAETTRLSVGDPSVDASFLEPYMSRWKETFVSTGFKVIDFGTTTDEVTVTEESGRKLIHRSVALDRPSGISSRTTLVVDAKSFAPVSTNESQSGGERLALAFIGMRMSGERKASESASTHSLSAALRTRAFDYFGGMNDLLLAALPLRTGATFEIPAVAVTLGAEYPEDGVITVTLHVRREDFVTLPSGEKRQAWVVDADTPIGFYKTWISKKAPYILRTIWVGPGGGRSTFELM
jgi:hypothetical protein